MLPREKLLKVGVENLTDEELIALILGTGNRKEDVFQLSRKILSILGTTGLKRMDVKQLASMDGLGIAKASRLVSAVELGRRLFSYDGRSISSMEEVFSMLRKYSYERQELLVVFYLDGGMRLIREELVAKGRGNVVNVHVRDIVQGAFENHASYLILAHNHPSGILKPSEEDLKLTKKISDVLRELEMELVEHVIFSKEGYICMLRDGYLSSYL